MSDFSTSAELDVQVSNRSLKAARSTIESELGDVTASVSASLSGGSDAARGQLAGILDATRKGYETLSESLQLHTERNDYLEELVDLVERGAASDDGGTSLLGTLGIARLATSAGAGAAAGVSASASQLLTITSPLELSAASVLAVSGTLALAATSVLAVQGTIELDAKSVLTTVGTFTVGIASVLAIAGALTLSAPAVLAVTGVVSLTAASVLAVTGTIGLNAPDVLSVSGTLTVAAAAALAITGTLSLPAAAVIAVVGTVTLAASEVIDVESDRLVPPRTGETSASTPAAAQLAPGADPSILDEIPTPTDPSDARPPLEGVERKPGTPPAIAPKSNSSTSAGVASGSSGNRARERSRDVSIEHSPTYDVDLSELEKLIQRDFRDLEKKVNDLDRQFRDLSRPA